MRLHALDEPVAIQKTAAGLEEIVDRAVARVDFSPISQIVQRNSGDREVEGSADLLRPGGVDEVANDITKLVGTLGKPLAGAVEHRLRIVLQRDPRRRKGLQHLFAHGAVACADIQHLDLSLARERRKQQHLL
jgi:hypothetical protein